MCSIISRQYNEEVKSPDYLDLNKVYYLLAVSSWAGVLTSLDLSFLIYKMNIIVVLTS